MSNGPAERWKISLFGPLSVRSPDGKAVSIASKKAGELLAYLALRRNSIVDRDSVSVALWPDVEEATGRNRLKQTLAVLRRQAEGIPVLIHGKNEIELSPSEVEIDIHVFDQRLRWLEALPIARRPEAARSIWEVVRAGLLPGLGSPWAEGDRSRYRVAAEQLYKRFEGYKAKPSVAFRAGEEFAGLKIPIVGRAAELFSVREWLREAQTRELYLSGPPGVGKTRLLEEVLDTSKYLCDAAVWLSGSRPVEEAWLKDLSEALQIHPDKFYDELTRLLQRFDSPLLAIDDIDEAPDSMVQWIHLSMQSVPALRLLATCCEGPRNGTVGGAKASNYVVPPLLIWENGEPFAAELLLRMIEHSDIRDRRLVDNSKTFQQIAAFLQGNPGAMEVAAELSAFVSPERLLKRVKENPRELLKHSPNGRKSLLERVSKLFSGLSAANQEALLKICACPAGSGEALAEQLLGPQWNTAIRDLLNHSFLLKTLGTSGPRWHVQRIHREAIFDLAGPAAESQAYDHMAEACGAIAGRAAMEIEEGDRAYWLGWLSDEYENLLHACRDGESVGNLSASLELVHSLATPLQLVGKTDDFEPVYAAILDRATPSLNLLSAKAQLAVVESLANSLDPPEGLTEISKFRGSIEGRVDAALLALTLITEAQVQRRLNKLQDAIATLERAKREYLSADRLRSALRLEPMIADIETELGLPAEADQRRQTALAEALVLGDHHAAGTLNQSLASEALAAERWFDAGALAETAVDQFRQAGEITTQAQALTTLATALQRQGDLEGYKSTQSQLLSLPSGDGATFLLRQKGGAMGGGGLTA